MDTTFDVDLEMGHSSRKSLRAASITGASAITDTTSGFAADEPSPDDYYGGHQAGTRTLGTCALLMLTPELFPQIRPVQRKAVVLSQLMERLSSSVCAGSLGKKHIILTIPKITAMITTRSLKSLTV